MTTRTIEEVQKMAAIDIAMQISESDDVSTPNGGWDSWLLEGLGSDEVCRLFGEPVEENTDGWSVAMAAKLVAYNEAGLAAAREIAATQLLDSAGGDAE